MILVQVPALPQAEDPPTQPSAHGSVETEEGGQVQCWGSSFWAPKVWLPTKATSSSKVTGQGSKLNHHHYGLLQAPADCSQVIPSHMTLGTQRPSDSCPSTQIRSILLEDRHPFPLLRASPRAGTWPLQRLGVGGRYRNRYLVAQNLVLVSRDMWWLGGVLSSLQQ